MNRATLADYEEIKAICNHPSMGWPHEVDPHNWLADPRNIVLFEDGNCAMFLWRWIGIYEAHVLFTKRGQQALDLGSLMLTAMFRSGAGMILSVVSKERRAASWFARQLGFNFRGEIESIEGLSEMYQLESREWVL